MGQRLQYLVGLVLVDNAVLTRFLGLYPILALRARLEDAMALAVAMVAIVVVAAATCAALDAYAVRPLGIESPALVVDMFVIAALASIATLALRAADLARFERVKAELPLLTANCAALGVVLSTARAQASIATATIDALATSVGFLVVFALLTALRERLDEARIPARLRGAPILLVTAALLSLAFAGFQGADR